MISVGILPVSGQGGETATEDEREALRAWTFGVARARFSNAQ
jgi:hypothetical protein